MQPLQEINHNNQSEPEIPQLPSVPKQMKKPKKQTINISNLKLQLLSSFPVLPTSDVALGASPIINKGTGAGGANTNVTGKSFEQKTENETRLLANGFVRKQIPGCEKNLESSFYYLIKESGPTESVVYLTQGGLKKYFGHFFNTKMRRHPDEAYLFRNGDKYTLKVLEKKNQNTSGSVDTKLLAGLGFVKEYEYHIKNENFTVRYAFCISDFLKKDYISEKSEALRHINQTYGIAVLFGDDPNYYETLDVWINS
jgi:hypothetical protein